MSEKLKQVILKNALKNVVFDGWSEELFVNVIEESNVNFSKAIELFPRKSIDIAIYHHFHDDQKLYNIDSKELVELRIRDRISKLIMARILIANQNKEAVKKSMAVFSLPFFFLDGKKMLQSTSDIIWKIAEQKEQVTNKFSKRISLMYLYSTSLLFWVNDESADFKETQSFVERSVNNFIKIEKFKKNFKNFNFKSNLNSLFN